MLVALPRREIDSGAGDYSDIIGRGCNMKAKKSAAKKGKATKATKAAAKGKSRAVKRAAPKPARKAAKRAAPDRFDHTFRAIYDHEIPWENDDVRGILKLPPGVQVKVLNYDPVMKRIDMKQRFPAGYVEPAHTHKSWHSILVTKGRMCVAGKDLRPGDYVFGWDVPHGPYEYPDGCEVFIVYMGDATHVWDKQDLLQHRNVWNPETEEGKQGVEEHIRKREVDVA
jgi:ChrR-like protein with cupin domain